MSDGKVVTRCYTAREDYYGWCATCNLNSTKESDPNFCSFDGDDDGSRSKKVRTFNELGLSRGGFFGKKKGFYRDEMRPYKANTRQYQKVKNIS